MEMAIIFWAGILIFLVLLLTAFFQWLWNTTMPEVFGLNTITFWLAFRLLLIAVFLTSGGFIRISFGW
ncbi:MAG: hypothetical protein WBV94_33155 [Blastocatellia bacterium]